MKRGKKGPFKGKNEAPETDTKEKEVYERPNKIFKSNCHKDSQ